jgi:serine/threonine-protein kinase
MLYFLKRMTLEPGTRFGSYEIVCPLGVGGMGVVYRARDIRLGREVAVKVLPQDVASHADSLARFEREAKALASLNHPNIAAIYGLEEANGVPHLVLELVEGETLAQRLIRGALPLREAMGICGQIASAIEAAHERGIVHRDLKPGNIMITITGNVKVLDFGLAKSDPSQAPGSDPGKSPTMTAYDGSTRAGVILGTAAYMSPEQARGRLVDRRGDVWSFGCVMYECIAGSPAFGGDTVSDLIARILEREPDWNKVPSSTPPRVREIMRRCLQKNADERPRDIRDVRLELVELASKGEKPDRGQHKSIGVLPFENQSGPEDEYFADGITDEILNALGQIDGLRVPARSSCFAFKGRRQDLRTVAEKLDVATVLEGTVRRAGTRLRITVQLVNATDGYQLWSERYDRQMTDVFEVQDEIAKAITGKLSVSMHTETDKGQGRHGTSNIEAYELFLKGRAYQLKRGRFLTDAIAAFERAVELDPNYAEALAWLADSYRLLGTFTVVPPAKVMPQAQALAQRALTLDPRLAEAYATIADVEAQYNRAYPKAVEAWKLALDYDPKHVRARCERAHWGHGFGLFAIEESLAEIHQAITDEPLNAWAGGMNCMLMAFAGKHEESIREGHRAHLLDKESFFAHWAHVQSYAWAGEYDRAIDMSSSLLALSGRNFWALSALGWSYGKAGKHDLAGAVYDELKGRSRLEYVSQFWMAVAAASVGSQDEAMQFAERAAAERESFVVVARVFPYWDAIRADKRFESIARSVWG